MEKIRRIVKKREVVCKAIMFCNISEGCPHTKKHIPATYNYRSTCMTTPCPMFKEPSNVFDWETWGKCIYLKEKEDEVSISK